MHLYNKLAFALLVAGSLSASAQNLGPPSGGGGSPTGAAGGGLTGTYPNPTVATNANLTGGVTSVGNAATVVTNANMTGDVTSVGNATTLAAGSASALNSGTLNNARLPARSSLQASPANQSTAQGTQTMVGVGATCAITPATSTRILILFSGIFNNGTISQSITMQLRFGTGGAPANGAAVTGTTVGNALAVTDLVASANEQFILQGIVTGLTAGVAVWIDFSGSAPTGTTSWSSMSCTSLEF